MNLFKNISIFRDQLCNCLPWGKDIKNWSYSREWEFWPNKDTKKELEGPWQPRLDYRELNDDPELKPTPFPEKHEYDMDYKYLLEENERLERLVECLILQLGKKESPLTDSQIKGKMTQINHDREEVLYGHFDDGGVDGIPRNK